MTNLPPIARATNPSTSFTGAAEVTDSGRRVTQMGKLLRAVKEHPGLTGGAYAELVGLERWSVTRRLSDLKNQSVIFQEGEALYKGHRQSRWWPVPEEPKQGTLFTLHGRPT